MWWRNALALFICAAFPLFFATALWAQGNAQSSVNLAAHAHGDGWQTGSVKTWSATGQLTVYRYDKDGGQSQDTFPVTVLHQAGPSGGGAQGDKLQRLIFKAPEAPPASAGPSQPVSVNIFSFDRLLTREGTDGTNQWHSAGPLSTQASGHPQRFIESQTNRSLEALFNFQKHGKNLKDVTADILAQDPGDSAPGNSDTSGHAHTIPSFAAAKNKHVIEMGGTSNKKLGIDTDATRYYIDDSTSMVTRMEFDYDSATDPFSKQPLALTEVYEFSDYRDVPVAPPNPFSTKPSGSSAGAGATVKFPFRIDRYDTGQLVESLVFTQVVLNQNLRPENFRK